ncbi:MAG: phosphate starvation protein PhoH [Candidatus Kapaibacterium sp.]|nr:MAG: phosphate starvation protein PhoH [Candidatus Kapabacteria bacterium]
MDYIERRIKIGEADPAALLGANDAHLHMLESRFPATIVFRNNTLSLRGAPDEIRQLESVINEMLYVLKRKGMLTTSDVEEIIALVDESPTTTGDPQQLTSRQSLNDVIVWGRKDPVRPRTARQREYVEKVARCDVVFAIGPAGTGKTYLAVAMALAALRSNRVQRIILTRPAVEAGESLGYLPGDLFEKVHPYLRPLLDAVSDMVPPDKLKNLNEKQIIEIIPLAYMRGRTLNNAFIILDEAQNTTIGQMKMFLTRLGQGSKAIITGDVTQIDLASSTQSGLLDVQSILRGIEGIEFVYFDKSDVVRHRLVMDIIDAYERSQQQRAQQQQLPLEQSPQ